MTALNLISLYCSSIDPLKDTSSLLKLEERYVLTCERNLFCKSLSLLSWNLIKDELTTVDIKVDISRTILGINSMFSVLL